MAEAMNAAKVPRRILSSLISSMAAGVVPRSGAPYIAIGRNEEVKALSDDLKELSDGGSSMRFIIGKYGSGKSFLIQLMRGYAVEHGYICADADLSPERRLCGAKGTGVATYRELMRNMSSKAAPNGGALSMTISKWLSDLRLSLASKGISPDSDRFNSELEQQVYGTVRALEASVGGFDFANILIGYYKAVLNEDEAKKSACLRYLRGEYANKTEAREQTGIRLSSIIDDDNWYDTVKLWAAFAQKIGYNGFVVFIDECVNLYKIPNRVSRENNYEKILAMFNDTLQGKAPGLEIILGGTPQFLEDTRRGLFSYEALKSRLSDSRFAEVGYRNLNSPVIRLRRLSDNELFALLKRIQALFEEYHQTKLSVTDENTADFLKLTLSKAGAAELVTPREMIRDYTAILNILLQNPNTGFADIVKSVRSDDAETDKSSSHREAPRTSSYDPADIDF